MLGGPGATDRGHNGQQRDDRGQRFYTALTSGKAYGFAANIINGTASPSVPDNLVAQGLLMFTGILTEAQEVGARPGV